MAGLNELFPNGGLFGTGFKMWGLNGTARVLIEYTETANFKGVLLEPADVKKDRYGFVYAPTRNGHGLELLTKLLGWCEPTQIRVSVDPLQSLLNSIRARVESSRQST